MNAPRAFSFGLSLLLLSGILSGAVVTGEPAGGPRATASGVLFSFRAPEAAVVYLAGDFNNWANNDGGKVSDASFAMTKGPDGTWTREIALAPGVYHYKFVVADGRGGFDWQADPFVAGRDGDQNTVLDVAALLAGTSAAPAWMSLSSAGPPRRVEGGVLFTFDGGPAKEVYLAGEFNNWANNDGGRVSDASCRMTRNANGLWCKVLPLRPRTFKYKFVKSDGAGHFDWVPDPHVAQKDNDNNSVFDFRAIAATGAVERVLVPGRALAPLAPLTRPRNPEGLHIREISVREAWVRPGETFHVSVPLVTPSSPDYDSTAGLALSMKLMRFDGVAMHEKRYPLGEYHVERPFDLPTAGLAEGGYLLEVTLEKNGTAIDQSVTVVTVCRNIADDLRYGFYANWKSLGSDYARKTNMLARLHINAVEYYDYFPAHGHYAPTTMNYSYEPFDVPILGEDIRRKIAAGHERNILSIAYIAAYASSRSVYEKHPYPMTTREGVPRIFNGSVMPEDAAIREGKPVWFYLMAIAKDSPWFTFILEELARALDDSPDDIVSFDGFEIDSYGHGRDDRYYSAGSASSGELLSTVLKTFVGEVWAMTHRLKEKSAVSFNCVNEYGIENMYDITDFIFIENWSGFKSGLDEIVDICFNHRAPRNQRVILKIYPADARLPEKVWTPENLRLILGATLTGGGSLMVAGEPDEAKGEMHGLNSLYYPDNLPMPAENAEIIRAYNAFDALMYRVTHGRNVSNLKTGFGLPGCIVREFDSDEKVIAVQILHNEENFEWSAPCREPSPLVEYEFAYRMPEGRRPTAVFYGTPDVPGLEAPRAIDWEWKDGHVRARLPRLETYGAVLIRYE